MADMSLQFLLLTVQSQVLPERVVYVPQRVMFPVMLSAPVALIRFGHRFVADREFL
jgi:hypothetical protein